LSLNFDPLPGEPQVVPVKKNPDNPFPDRLTIGRATNCDVVIRLAFVSKVHAHLFIQGQQLTLRDNRASNFTFHNHRKLESGGSKAVKLGDVLSFGALDLELVDAARFYELLRAIKLNTQTAATRG
jgi:pSer/pThr/pTyr-binding forkhead associated (FHA) protein